MQILKQSYFRFGPSEGVTTSWESHRKRSFRAEWRMGFSWTLLGEWVRTWWSPMEAPRTMLFTWYYGTFLLRSRASPSRRQKQRFHLNLSSLVRITFPSIHRLPRDFAMYLCPKTKSNQNEVSNYVDLRWDVSATACGQRLSISKCTNAETRWSSHVVFTLISKVASVWIAFLYNWLMSCNLSQEKFV